MLQICFQIPVQNADCNGDITSILFVLSITWIFLQTINCWFAFFWKCIIVIIETDMNCNIQFSLCHVLLTSTCFLFVIILLSIYTLFNEMKSMAVPCYELHFNCKYCIPIKYCYFVQYLKMRHFSVWLVINLWWHWKHFVSFHLINCFFHVYLKMIVVMNNCVNIIIKINIGDIMEHSLSWLWRRKALYKMGMTPVNKPEQCDIANNTITCFHVIPQETWNFATFGFDP